MTTPTYRLAVERLEQLLSPRVVSRTLRMGMQPEGLTPEAVDADGLEPVLKGPVYRQLQVAMSPERAREAVEGLLEELRNAEAASNGHHAAPAASEADPAVAAGDSDPPEGRDAGGPPADAAPGHLGPVAPARSGDGSGDVEQDPRLQRLRQEMRPFNLYFEWPEVRKLRAQIQLFEQELRAGGTGEEVEAEAERQLDEVRQKLEDTLVHQARDLAEIEEAFEEVKPSVGRRSDGSSRC